jgi:hypothetical protein
MATVVQLKRSETLGAIPTAGDIAVGELAVNLLDGALFTKRTDGAIIEIGVSEQVPVFFADEVDLGDLTVAGVTYDMGSLTGGSPTSGGIQLTDISVTDSGGDGSLAYNNTSGVFTYTGPSATDVRAHISVTDSGGDGSLAYDNSTGVITYTGPSVTDVRAHFSASTGISITGGAISTSITQYTDALARGAVSVTDSGGDGSLAYNSTTGVITYTGPSATDVRAHFSAGTGITITDGAIATDTTVIATKQYVDDIAQGLHIHASCDAATQTTLASISGGTVTYNNGTAGVGATLTTTGTYTTIDGVTLSNDMRILVKNEATTANNGIYVRTSATVLTRATDFNTAAEIAGGDFTFVTAGTLYNSTGWVQIDDVTTVGTTSVEWLQFSGAGTYTAGTGLTLTGNSFSVNVAQTQITSVGTLTGLTVSGTTSLPSATSIGDVSSTELGYLDGVTSAIQTQLNAKASTGKAIAMAIVFGG